MPDAKDVVSVPLPTEEGDDVVIGQQSVGAEEAIGGGEWPSPDAPATGPSPGPGPGTDAAVEGTADGAPPAPATGDRQLIKDVLDADPVAGGSRAGPPLEDDEE